MFESSQQGKCVIFSAPSGAGKTTIVRHLLERDLPLAFSVSACSRAPRPNEVDGKDYHFLGVEEFKKRIEKDAFIEWEEVYSDYFYGTLKEEIERIWAEGKTVLFDVDVVGGLNLKKIFGENALAVFVQPPTITSLKYRLKNRSTESESKIAQRMAKAKSELAYAKDFDYILINDNLEEAFATAYAKVKSFLEK